MRKMPGTARAWLCWLAVVGLGRSTAWFPIDLAEQPWTNERASTVSEMSMRVMSSPPFRVGEKVVLHIEAAPSQRSGEASDRHLLAHGHFFKCSLLSAETLVGGDVLDIGNGTYAVEFTLVEVGLANVSCSMEFTAELARVVLKRAAVKPMPQTASVNHKSVIQDRKSFALAVRETSTGIGSQCGIGPADPTEMLVTIPTLNATSTRCAELEHTSFRFMEQKDHAVANAHKAFAKRKPPTMHATLQVLAGKIGKAAQSSCTQSELFEISRGYWRRHVNSTWQWEYPHCSVSPARMGERDRALALHGDTTLRQWIELLEGHAAPLCRECTWAGAKTGVNFTFHSLPHFASVGVRASSLAGTLEYIKSFGIQPKVNRDTTLVLSFVFHWVSTSLPIFRLRVAAIATELEALLKRRPDVRVVYKTGHQREEVRASHRRELCPRGRAFDNCNSDHPHPHYPQLPTVARHSSPRNRQSDKAAHMARNLENRLYDAVAVGILPNFVEVLDVWRLTQIDPFPANVHKAHDFIRALIGIVQGGRPPS